MPVQQGAQDHQAAFAGQQFRRRQVQLFKDELGEPVEGQDLQARKTGEDGAGEKLAFELEGGLFGREDDQRIAVGLALQRGPHPGETAEGFSAAGGADEEAHGHAGMFMVCERGAKGNLAD